MTAQMGYFSYRLSEAEQDVQQLKRLQSRRPQAAVEVQSPSSVRSATLMNNWVLARESLENNIMSYSAVGAGLAGQAALSGSGPQLRALWALVGIPAAGLGYWVYGKGRRVDFDVSTAKDAVDRAHAAIEVELERETQIDRARPPAATGK